MASVRIVSNGMNPTSHKSVMLSEVLEILKPKDGAVYIDSTLGGGGYSEGLLKAAKCRVCAIDRDPVAIRNNSLLSEKYPGRLTLIKGCFGTMERLLAPHGIHEVDGVAFDLGVSSMQLDDASRGFSFRHNAILDMRMGNNQKNAKEVINSASEGALADIIYNYGEERKARPISRAIVATRKITPITHTHQLAEIVRRVVGYKTGSTDPATRTFQALRIYVNEELSELDLGLSASERLLRPGGRLAVVAFHSLEDRRVKRFLLERSSFQPNPSRHLPIPTENATKTPQPSFKILNRRARKPKRSECVENPRSRSAKLRGAERTREPVFAKESLQ